METKKTILIADTSEEFRSVLAEAIQMEEGLEVVGQTGDGQEAIQLAQERRPDVLVMDLVLGRVDGFDVLDAVKDLPYSEPVKAYIACNLELEYALEYLMQRLEEAGVADKTCIVLTNDHYPYGLTEGEYNELAGQTLDTTFEKYRNSFICYVPGLSENIVVDEYCSTADILPTLLNLFGVDYDSRLLAGTDVLSSGLHVAVLSDKSFLTKAFRYDAGTETVIPADENTTVSDELAEAYRLYVDSRFQLSGNILNSDYYAHVFSKESSGGSLADTVVFTDIKSIFNQASVLYMYRKGYVDPETPDTFGGKAGRVYRCALPHRGSAGNGQHRPSG